MLAQADLSKRTGPKLLLEFVVVDLILTLLALDFLTWRQAALLDGICASLGRLLAHD